MDSIARSELAIAITGSGGSGAVTAGQILLHALCAAGYYALLTRSAGPQIRGGESLAKVRLGGRPLACMGDRLDLLVGLDWANVGRFLDELPLDPDSLILADADDRAAPLPDGLAALGARVLRLPLRATATAACAGRVNMVALGVLWGLQGWPRDALEQGLREVLGARGGTVLVPARAGIAAGLELAEQTQVSGERPVGPCCVAQPDPGAAARPGQRWLIGGNAATGVGALRGGVRFVAAYPITPASEILEWLAPRLPMVGGALLQAEDELASVNMIIGASFGGVPAMTATSGPGLSLMMEGIGLAVASETPILIVDVQRGGPSTGIPTKSEQSDLNLALHGLHGDAPHLVLAALSIADAVATTQWAARLAERLQTAAILLSDQSIGQSQAVIDPPDEHPVATAAAATPSPAGRLLESRPEPGYRRYRLTGDGCSPMTVPGTPLGMYTADGLEHNESGAPSSLAADHLAQLDKRRRKLEDFAFGPAWADLQGQGDWCLVTWGSSAGACAEAADRLTQAGHPTRLVALRLLAPLRRDALREALAGASRILVVEQNQGAQLFAYLHGQRALPDAARSHARPGPLPPRPGEIARALTDWPEEHS